MNYIFMPMTTDTCNVIVDVIEEYLKQANLIIDRDELVRIINEFDTMASIEEYLKQSNLIIDIDELDRNINEFDTVASINDECDDAIELESVKKSRVIKREENVVYVNFDRK